MLFLFYPSSSSFSWMMGIELHGNVRVTWNEEEGHCVIEKGEMNTRFESGGWGWNKVVLAQF